MTHLSAEARRQRLLQKFHRSGREGTWTRPFDEFPAQVRTELLDMAAVREGELPVLLFFRSPEHWVLLTTEQVMASRPGGILHLAWEAIEDATVDRAHVRTALSSSPDGKLGLSQLRILLRHGESVELELEAGAAFFGFWNVLKRVAAMSHL